MSDKVKRLAPPIEVIKLHDIVDALEELIEIEKRNTPRGERASFLVWVKDEITNVKQSYPVQWFTVTLHNYSGTSVYFALNEVKPVTDRTYSDEVRVGETRQVRFGSPKIDKVNMVCPSGTSALIRVSGIF